PVGLVAEPTRSSSSGLPDEATVPHPGAAAASGSGDAAFWLEMADQVRNKLVYVVDDDSNMPTELAIAATDDEHPFWMWLAGQMKEEFDTLGLDNPDVLLVPSGVEYDVEFLLATLAAQASSSSFTAIDDTDLSKPQDVVARGREHNFVRRIASIFTLFW
ncbi:hypothetical protein FOZ62_008594, partial [Perkinsus olseni]